MVIQTLTQSSVSKSALSEWLDAEPTGNTTKQSHSTLNQTAQQITVDQDKQVSDVSFLIYIDLNFF